MSSMVLPIMPMPSVQQCSTHGGASPATFAPATDNYPHLPLLIDASASPNSLLFQQSQMPNILSQVSFRTHEWTQKKNYCYFVLFIYKLINNLIFQGNGQHLWEADEQRLKLDTRFAINSNLSSF